MIDPTTRINPAPSANTLEPEFPRELSPAQDSVGKVAKEVLTHEEPSLSRKHNRSYVTSVKAPHSKRAKVKSDTGLILPPSTETQGSSAASSDHKPNPVLDYTQRPTELKKEIDKAFKDASTRLEPWLCNGCSEYETWKLRVNQLLDTLIQEAPPDRKEFTVIDIGAGNCSWGMYIADFFATKPYNRPDFTLHIISTQAETKSAIPEYEERGRCKIHNLHGVKAEEFFEELEKREFHLQNEVDLAVTNMCLIHLCDPAGTFPQIFNMIRPGGIFLFDGFVFALEGQEAFEQEFLPTPRANANLIQLLLDTKAPFLTQGEAACSLFNSYILRRPDTTPCLLPMSYSGIRQIPWGGFLGASNTQIASHRVTEFRRQPQPGDLPFMFPSRRYGDFYGDKQLFDWLKGNNLFRDEWQHWQYLQDPDAQPLCDAIWNNDSSAIHQLLAFPDTDINAPDKVGQTPLHCLVRATYKMEFCTLVSTFDTLLKRNANIHFCTKQGLSPLHYAAGYDRKGTFVPVLIQAGGLINQKAVGDDDLTFNNLTPLDCAVGAKNLKAVEILINSGAQICTRTSEELQALAWPLVLEGKIAAFYLEHAKTRLE